MDPESLDFIKFNVDVGFVAITNEALAGIIIIVRDYEGRVMLYACKNLGHVSHVYLAEGRAMQKGISLAFEMGFRSLMVKTHSLYVHRLLSFEVDDSSKLGYLVFL